MRVRRTAGFFIVVMLLLAGDVVPAAAHDPVFLSEEHTSPEVGPLLPDGTISFAMYGRLTSPSATQGFQAGMKDGDALNLSLLIPAVLPETSFEVGSLPKVQVVRPDGTEFSLTPTVREIFHEPYTNTRYLRLGDHQEVARQGYYSFSVSGARPGRYVVSIGILERFGTEIIRYTRPLIVGRATQPIYQWFDEPVIADQATGSEAPDVDEGRAEVSEPRQPASEIETAGTPNVGNEQQLDADAEPCDCGRPRRSLVVVLSVGALVVALAILKLRQRRRSRTANDVPS